MRRNRTSKWNVMTIWISLELSLFNFERLDILFALIGHPSVKLWPFEFLDSVHCSISRVSIYYAPESNFRVNSYDHLNFARASVVEFWASRYVMHLNQTSEIKVMTIWISRELPLFNFERHDILCPRIIRVKSYDHLNSRELPLFNLECLDILCHWIGHPCEKLWPLEFSRASVVELRASRYIMLQNRTSEYIVMTIWILRELPLLNFERLDMSRALIGLPR